MIGKNRRYAAQRTPNISLFIGNPAIPAGGRRDGRRMTCLRCGVSGGFRAARAEPSLSAALTEGGPVPYQARDREFPPIAERERQ